MIKRLFSILAFILIVTIPHYSFAELLKVFVAEFSVSGAPDREDLKMTLQRILASRLDSGQLQLVESADKAEILVNGSYALFGKVLTLDVLLKNRESGDMLMFYEQGAGLDELIPAAGRLAEKINRELAKARTAPSPAAVPPLAVKPVSLPAPSVTSKGSYAIKANSNLSGSWTSDPLDGVFTSIALGRTLPSGERELFIATEHSLCAMRKGTDLQKVAEIAVPVPARILAIDTADLDHDGIPELYVTIVDRESLTSRVYLPTETGLELLVENMPWFFRGVGEDFKSRTLYAQKMATNGNFYGGIATGEKTGKRIEFKGNFKLPGPGNIFNFNRFRDRLGSEKTVILDEDGYLSVYSADGKEQWKSNDKFGGSETYFNLAANASVRTMDEQLQWHFLQQRIRILPDGILLLPHNEGLFSVGNSRSYTKYSLYGSQWNGALFKETWHARQVPGYLTDYEYDPATREILLLEVVQKKGVMTHGRTTLSINRVD